MAFINTILDRCALVTAHAAVQTHLQILKPDMNLTQMVASCASCLIVAVHCSLANSLVITAVGGGTEVIPFLTGRFLQSAVDKHAYAQAPFC